MSKQVYVLKQDLPDYKKGAEIEWDGTYYTFKEKASDGIAGRWPALYVENNPEWFVEKKEERHKCKYCGCLTSQDDKYCYKNPNGISMHDAQPPVDTDTPFQWTTQLVNEFACKLVMSEQGIAYTAHDFIKEKQSKSTPKEEKLYTKDELLKAQSDAFYAAQEMDFTSTHAVKRYLTFTEYIHSKNK